MTDIHPLSRQASPGIIGRYRAEARYRLIGLIAIIFSLGFLGFLVTAIAMQGFGAFWKTEVRLVVSQSLVDQYSEDSFSLMRKVVLENVENVSGRRDRKEVYALVGEGAEDDLQAGLLASEPNDGMHQIWVRTSDDVDQAAKGEFADFLVDGFSDKQVAWLYKWRDEGNLRKSFNTGFFVNGDSRDAERAGIGGALAGSLYTLVVCLALSFGVGILAAIYLEEFAPRNIFTSIIEVNINNLATVPSIIFGLLGLAVFLNLFGLPRSSSLVGGMVLALMTLPTIIIASRVSLQAVPPSIREAALGLGASRIQAVFHHVVPLALPGMLTGTILGMARALGETAPLLMIGMVAFIADPPTGFGDPASALPVQVYLWADSPERAFGEKTAGAILVLLVFLVVMNLAAILLRKKMEKKW